MAKEIHSAVNAVEYLSNMKKAGREGVTMRRIKVESGR